MFIDFTGFAGDCLINGKLDLRAPRLTDQLNADPLVHLVDVTLEDLGTAQRVAAPEFTIERSQLCAVRATGPRGSRALRIATAPHRLRAQIGPYTVLGRLHEPPGVDALATFSQRDLMVPLTDATIAFMVGGILDVRDWSTLVINRELASWYHPVGDDTADQGAPAELSLGQPGPAVVELVPVGGRPADASLQAADRARRQAGAPPRGAKSR
ncbi:MAG TPA: hypothetical protein VIB99_11425 [Candidatus Limnocylindrales bacterium]|jgi:hypothetical protein